MHWALGLVVERVKTEKFDLVFAVLAVFVQVNQRAKVEHKSWFTHLHHLPTTTTQTFKTLPNDLGK